MSLSPNCIAAVFNMHSQRYIKKDSHMQLQIATAAVLDLKSIAVN